MRGQEREKYGMTEAGLEKSYIADFEDGVEGHAESL